MKKIIINLDECFECGHNIHIHMHHVVPRILGGKKTLPLCEKCHGLVHNINLVKSGELRRLGIEKAKQNGTYKGRVKGSVESTEEFLNKENNILIIEGLNNGLSLRKTAKFANRSLGTVQKVKKYLKL
tara:strand:+ start:173920 stop:174303 length:384 start_codon:yes stop_codon:yes gene_type:complete